MAGGAAGVEIRLTARDGERLRGHLLRGDGREQVAFLFAGATAGPDGLTLAVREMWAVPPEAFVAESERGLEVGAPYMRRVLDHARETGYSLVEAHSHPFAGEGVTFSQIDRQSDAAKFRYVAAKIPHIRHATMVFGRQGVDAHVYDAVRGVALPVDRVTVLSVPRQRLVPTSAGNAADRTFGRIPRGDEGGEGDEATEGKGGDIVPVGGLLAAGAGGGGPRDAPADERYSRQALLFGAEGQRALGDMTVGLAGVGSVGMLFAQQLVYLGVRRFVLVDPDVVEASNLNRLVGATPADAVAATPKVEVARRLIHAAAPEAEVHAAQLSLLQPEAHGALKRVDVLMGATDNHGARLVLNNRLAVQYLIPYIDVGVGFETEPGGRITRAGGWVRVVQPGAWCLNCIDALDREQAKLDLLGPGERAEAQARGYIPTEEITAPAVIFLNGTLAALAVAEFMNMIVGFKPVQPLVLYDLLKGRATPVAAQPRAGCAVCDPEALLALGDLEPFPAYGQDSPLPSGDELVGAGERASAAGC